MRKESECEGEKERDGRKLINDTVVNEKREKTHALFISKSRKNQLF